MSWLSDFTCEMNRTFSVYNLLSGLDGNRNPEQGHESTPSLVGAQAAFYEGSAAQRFVSDRYKTETVAVLIVDPIHTVPDGSKIVLDNGLEFLTIHGDDVMFQGDILVVALRSEDYGVII